MQFEASEEFYFVHDPVQEVILRSHRLPGWPGLAKEPAARCEARQVSQSKHLIRKTKWEGGEEEGCEISMRSSRVIRIDQK